MPGLERRGVAAAPAGRGRRPVVVVLRALGLGDLLTAVPALRALAEAFPEHRRLLAAPAALAPLVRLVGTDAGGPAIHAVTDTGELQPLPSEASGADVAVNFHGRGPESHRLLLASWPRRLLAFHNPEVPETASGPAWIDGEHEVERWCRLLQASGIAADPSRIEISAPPGPPPGRVAGATVLHPGAASAARRWPPARWAEIARRERSRGRRVVLTGGRAELALANEIARAARLPGDGVLAGRTDLEQLAAVVAAAGRVVCSDTGVAHLATALRRPSVLLFGPTRPSEWGPPPDRVWHRVLWRGHTGDPHGLRPHRGLLEIEPDDVERELDELDELPQSERLAAAP